MTAVENADIVEAAREAHQPRPFHWINADSPDVCQACGRTKQEIIDTGANCDRLLNIRPKISPWWGKKGN